MRQISINVHDSNEQGTCASNAYQEFDNMEDAIKFLENYDNSTDITKEREIIEAFYYIRDAIQEFIDLCDAYVKENEWHDLSDDEFFEDIDCKINELIVKYDELRHALWDED